MKQSAELDPNGVYDGKVVLDGTLKTLAKLITGELISSLKFSLTDEIGVQEWTFEGWNEEDITALQAVIATIVMVTFDFEHLEAQITDAVNTYSMIVDKRIEKRAKINQDPRKETKAPVPVTPQK